MKRIARILAVMFAMALVVAACGSDDEATDTAAEVDTEETGSDAESDEAMEDEAMEEESDEAMEDEAMEEESDEAMEDEAMEEESDEAMEDEAMEEESDEAREEEAMEEESALLGLEIVSIDFDAAEVVIANNGDAEVDLDGHFLCNFPDYAAISGVGAVAPGATVTVPIPVTVSAAAGELGLYTTDSYSSPDAIQAYVEWGSPDHERSPVAQEAGIWDGVPLTVEGSVLTVG